MSGVSPFQLTNFTIDNGALYKAKLDGNMQAIQQIAAAFQCLAQASPNMTVRVMPGVVNSAGGGTQAQSTQNSSTIVAPVTNPRIDRVVINAATGVAAVVTGAENAVPVAPAVPPGFYPCAQIALTVALALITNLIITDERAINFNLAYYAVTNLDLERARRRSRLFTALNFC